MNYLMDHWKTLNLTPRDGIVLVALWRRANYKTNRLIGITIAQLADYLGMPVSSVKASMAKLQDRGVLRRNRGGKHRATQYVVVAPDQKDCFSGLETEPLSDHSGLENRPPLAESLGPSSEVSQIVPAKHRLDGGYSLEDGDDSRATPAPDTKFPF